MDVAIDVATDGALRAARALVQEGRTDDVERQVHHFDVFAVLNDVTTRTVADSLFPPENVHREKSIGEAREAIRSR